MGYDHLLGLDGNIPFPLRDSQHPSIQRRPQPHGIFFPEHVQRHSIWVDARGLPGPGQRDGLWSCQLLGTPVFDCVAAHCAAYICNEHQWGVVHGRSGRFHLHDRDSLDTY